MKPEKELETLYMEAIEDAKRVFGRHFTCKRKVAPHGEKFEVALIPRENAEEGEIWDNVQVCLKQFPATFMTAYLRKGEKRILEISTRSGSVKDLWGMIKPIIDSIAGGDIGIRSYCEKTEAEHA